MFIVIHRMYMILCNCDKKTWIGEKVTWLPMRGEGGRTLGLQHLCADALAPLRFLLWAVLLPHFDAETLWCWTVRRRLNFSFIDVGRELINKFNFKHAFSYLNQVAQAVTLLAITRMVGGSCRSLTGSLITAKKGTGYPTPPYLWPSIVGVATCPSATLT